MTNLASRTIVLITGANQGIGYAVAQGLLAYKGFYILLGSRNASRGSEAAAKLDPTGQSVEAITIDVADDTSIQQAADLVESRHGRLDVLINNAGINPEIDILIQQQKKPQGDGPSSQSLDLAQQREIFRSVYEVNLFGAAQVTEAFTPLLEKSSVSPVRIIFVSSHTGSMGLRLESSGADYAKFSRPSFPVYRSSKAALNMLTLHYAAKFQEKGWKVNASCPNLTDTNFTRGFGNGRPASESAVNIIRLATLTADGESGVYSDEIGAVPW
ncbi:hypothetical protein N7462_005482 [Penicillium macrosclerotiorum]|uniref:uncharacterized protein n=1 Tax=Penicillium macrosclerotiorum TaxID=303699 RepID=UPI00254676F4|nr:uncharacterized protein N7462_005482 [Penicillium macrosclerotiorum]KAJ5682317.1 hypothetical protein N7462_005482 [Penicillium macrosclerotiorum]